MSAEWLPSRSLGITQGLCLLRLGDLAGFGELGDVGIERLVQADEAALQHVGGKLVYATCSILPGENNRQVAAFLTANPTAWTLEEELTLLPDNNTGDGFYAARLLRA